MSSFIWGSRIFLLSGVVAQSFSFIRSRLNDCLYHDHCSRTIWWASFTYNSNFGETGVWPFVEKENLISQETRKILEAISSDIGVLSPGYQDVGYQITQQPFGNILFWEGNRCKHFGDWHLRTWRRNLPALWYTGSRSKCRRKMLKMPDPSHRLWSILGVFVGGAVKCSHNDFGSGTKETLGKQLGASSA
jgi:hypothetical protein